jgi:predicted RNA binding protein YcfA (HicA-like mRNA interferase family)
MGKSMKIRDLIKRIEMDGWHMVRQAGSHRQYRHPTKPGKVTVAGDRRICRQRRSRALWGKRVWKTKAPPLVL